MCCQGIYKAANAGTRGRDPIYKASTFSKPMRDDSNRANEAKPHAKPKTEPLGKEELPVAAHKGCCYKRSRFKDCADNYGHTYAVVMQQHCGHRGNKHRARNTETSYESVVQGGSAREGMIGEVKRENDAVCLQCAG